MKLKKGQKVVMHTCYLAGIHKGRVWECREDSFISNSDTEVVFLKGFTGYFDCEYLQFIKPITSDRFLIEEIVKRIENEEREYFTILCKDLLSEYIGKEPLTEEQRIDYLKATGMDDDFIESAYFSSEEELKKHLGK